MLMEEMVFGTHKTKVTPWTQVPGTENLSSITEIAAPGVGTTLWLGTGNGVRKWEFGNPSLDAVGAGTGICSSINCTEDGTVLIASVGNSKRTYVSNDSGATWIDKSTVNGGVNPNRVLSYGICYFP